MTLTLDLSADAEEVARRAAAAVGLSVSDHLSSRLLACDDRVTCRQLAQRWDAAGVWGVWAERDDIGDSSDFARTLRTRAEVRSGRHL